MDRSGTTLPELASALLLLGVILGIGLPPLRSWSDRMAVSTAREEAVALLSAARREAPGRGGAVVLFDPAEGTGRVLLADSTFREVAFRDRLGVELDPGGTGVAEVRFDGLALGRVASRTLRFRRGGAEAALVISSYGRVRRRRGR